MDRRKYLSCAMDSRTSAAVHGSSGASTAWPWWAREGHGGHLAADPAAPPRAPTTGSPDMAVWVFFFLGPRMCSWGGWEVVAQGALVVEQAPQPQAAAAAAAVAKAAAAMAGSAAPLGTSAGRAPPPSTHPQSCIPGAEQPAQQCTPAWKNMGAGCCARTPAPRACTCAQQHAPPCPPPGRPGRPRLPQSLAHR